MESTILNCERYPGEAIAAALLIDTGGIRRVLQSVDAELLAVLEIVGIFKFRSWKDDDQYMCPLRGRY